MIAFIFKFSLKPLNLKNCYSRFSGTFAIAKGFGLDSEKISCRGSIYFIEEVNIENADFTAFGLDTTTAWNPLNEVWDAILSLDEFEGIEYVFRAEEGTEININTDKHGWYFDERYKLDIWLDISLISGEFSEELRIKWFSTKVYSWDDINNKFEEVQYFSSFEELQKLFSDIFHGKVFEEISEMEKHLQKVLDEVFGKDEWGWFNLSEFSFE